MHFCSRCRLCIDKCRLFYPDISSIRKQIGISICACARYPKLQCMASQTCQPEHSRTSFPERHQVKTKENASPNILLPDLHLPIRIHSLPSPTNIPKIRLRCNPISYPPIRRVIPLVTPIRTPTPALSHLPAYDPFHTPFPNCALIPAPISTRNDGSSHSPSDSRCKRQYWRCMLFPFPWFSLSTPAS